MDDQDRRQRQRNIEWMRFVQPHLPLLERRFRILFVLLTICFALWG